MKRELMVIFLIIGVVLMIIAFVYFTTPAKLLPAYFPGHDLVLKTVHFKHGVAAFILGLLSFAIAWFNSGGTTIKSEDSIEE